MLRLLGSKKRAKVGESSPPKVDPARAPTRPPSKGSVRSKGSEPGSSNDASEYSSAMDYVRRRIIPQHMSMRAQELEEARVRAEEVTKEFIQGTRQQAKPEERRAAAMVLARYVNQEFGDAAEQLGISLRAGRGLAYVLQLIFEGDMQLQRTGLMILANLASDAFDPKSGETKRQVFNANIFHRIKDFVFASDVVAQTYACACLQNLCKDVEFAKLVKTFELIPELERIVRGAKAVPKPEHTQLLDLLDARIGASAPTLLPPLSDLPRSSPWRPAAGSHNTSAAQALRGRRALQHS